MSADGVADAFCAGIADCRFGVVNFANPDMVGHTGVIPAAIKAVETVDTCLARVLAAAAGANARVLVTADHGNCEMMIDPATGGPHTAHTTNPVPFIVVDPDGARPMRSGGALRDVGPTVLAMLGIDRPAEMTGVDLREMGVKS
jgi:2,3-bisphosphoglycerate-independent phosphoglycerate mutase